MNLRLGINPLLNNRAQVNSSHKLIAHKSDHKESFDCNNTLASILHDNVV